MLNSRGWWPVPKPFLPAKLTTYKSGLQDVHWTFRLVLGPFRLGKVFIIFCLPLQGDGFLKQA